MARPQKKAADVKSHVITIRFDDLQYSILCSNATRAGLSKTDYIRRQAVKGKVDATYRVVADFPEIRKVTKELAAIGNNLNQIAKYFNSGGLQTAAIREEITRGLNEIMEIREIVAALGGYDGNTKTHSKQKQ